MQVNYDDAPNAEDVAYVLEKCGGDAAVLTVDNLSSALEAWCVQVAITHFLRDV